MAAAEVTAREGELRGRHVAFVDDGSPLSGRAGGSCGPWVWLASATDFVAAQEALPGCAVCDGLLRSWLVCDFCHRVGIADGKPTVVCAGASRPCVCIIFSYHAVSKYGMAINSRFGSRHDCAASGSGARQAAGLAGAPAAAARSGSIQSQHPGVYAQGGVGAQVVGAAAAAAAALLPRHLYSASRCCLRRTLVNYSSSFPAPTLHCRLVGGQRILPLRTG